MRKAHVHRPATVVVPDHMTRISRQRVHVDSLGGPKTGRDVGHAIPHQHATAQRPARHHAPIAQQHVIPRRRAELPDRFAVSETQAAQHPIVAREVHLACGHGGGEAQRGIGDKMPKQGARVQIQTAQRVVGGGGEQRFAIDDDGLKCVVEIDPVQFLARLRPGGLRRRGRAPAPADLQREDQRLLHRTGSCRVPFVHRPVARHAHQRRGHNGERTHPDRRIHHFQHFLPSE